MRQSSPAAYFQGGVQQSSYSAPNFNMAGAVMGPLMPGMPSMIPGPPHAAYGPMAGQPGFAMPEPAAHFRPMPPELMAQRGQTAPFRSTGDPVFMPVRPHPGSAGRNEKAGIRSQPVSNRTTPQGTPHSSQPGTPTKRTLSSQRLDPMRPMPPISPSHSATSASGRLQGHELDENDNIKVVVRVRPLNDREIANRDLSAVQVSEDDPHKMQVVVPGPKGATMARNFTFHGILSPSSKQSDVLKMCGITQLLDAALAGFHVTIFAYGQTGSGKTFTMSGREEMIENDDYSGDTDDGIVTRAVLYLFEQIQKRNNGCKYSLKASYCEIYNEALYDLLRFNKQQLAVRWDPNKGFYVPDLYVKECHSVADMLQVISRGMRHRKMGSHELNLESSRSHSIMTVHCDASPSNPEDHDYGIPKFGKISFVDLAGSERVKDSKSTGDMLKETSSINRSLFTLGKVISALADTQAGVANTAHIPYRDSKLTKLLMDSLGGSALALMIACCSPSVAHVDETLSTLSYATRAKNIRNKPIVQVNEQEATIAALRREVHLLRAENHYLRDQCQGNQLAAGQQQSLSIQPDSSRTWSRGSSFNSTTDAAGNTRVRRPTFSELTQGQHPLPLAQSLDGVGGGSMSNGLVKASSAGNLQALEGPADAAKDHSAATTSGGAASHPQQPLSSEELAQRLAEAQRMVARFSRENERLAVQNDQLRNKRTLVDNDYKGALDEVDWLRLRLENLENTLLAGASSGSPSKLGTEGRSEASSGTHTPTHGEQLAKANSSSVLNSSIGARLRDLSASQDGSPDATPPRP
ncbi:hypothetical protein WJX72_002675 [[Myrmecia] bisecta]|uniref:Kinesin-like protein n=1 Tax=[Myrmecia] bisecta TaxID=41462 RepID=A0AAW1P631_9CHLO